MRPFTKIMPFRHRIRASIRYYRSVVQHFGVMHPNTCRVRRCVRVLISNY